MFFLNDFYSDMTKDYPFEEKSISRDPSKLLDFDNNLIPPIPHQSVNFFDQTFLNDDLNSFTKNQFLQPDIQNSVLAKQFRI